MSVAQDGTGRYTNIQAAITAAPSNAIIRLGPGVFAECLRIDKPLVIEGQGWDKTIIRKEPGPRIESDGHLMRLLAPQLEKAQSNDEKMAVIREFMQKQTEPVLLVQNTSGVQVRGVRFTYPRLIGQNGGFPNAPIVHCTNAQVSFANCAVVGGWGIGMLFGKDCEVDMSRCLVAGVWGNGIEIGERSGPARQARLRDCEVRNCHHVAIMMGAMNQDATIERCRISGSAWHGIQYGSGSPAIISNLISGHARSGIYAGGKSSATVRGNIFYRNEMDGISCWFDNQDVIEGNTFIENLREGVATLGTSAPILRRNIFVGHPQAIFQGAVAQPKATNQPLGKPVIEHNLFWKNGTNWGRIAGMEQPSVAGTNLDARVGSLDAFGNRQADPAFKDSTTRDFGLKPDSPALSEKAGVAAPLGFSSPWPLQPEEAAIIPEGETRDSRQWKGAPARPKRR